MQVVRGVLLMMLTCLVVYRNAAHSATVARDATTDERENNRQVDGFYRATPC